ncbi:zinc-dependent alcohol dehydrogenase family protein [Nitrosococcus wardiae]|uniref:Alcohol dehydrogenase n=1 Tax=Nitrosococcus wardiae TaxID=1814290 RepID=A0A4P7BYK8_9GAMM|nr:zinc-dependent alcohol dehydrogenase family protein [Nitrosococcus wardiae]QBQ53562.1 alcohol dehydrogenase [Nitrosococcus wardiae]
MKGIVMTAAGGPEVLQLQELPKPAIQRPDEVLVRLKGAGINPVDAKLRTRGTFYPDRSPTILGCDGAGTVEAVGAEVKNFKEGDEVYFCFGGIGGPQGNYAEYVTVSYRSITKKPKSLSFLEAAAAPLVLITAWEALHDRARIQPEHTVLVHGGAGGVGHVAIQLAKRAGARVCTTVGSEEKGEFVRSLGADYVINYRETDFVEAIMEWTEGKGIEVAFDTVGGGTFEKSCEAVAIYGDLVTTLQPSADMNWSTARTRNLRFSLELMLTPMHLGLASALEHQADILRCCAELFDSEHLSLHLRQTFPLEEAAAAHRLLEQGGMIGKLALEVG